MRLAEVISFVRIVTEIKEELEKEGEDPRFGLEKARCLGCCTAAPAVEIDGEIYDNQWVVPYNPYLLAKYDW